MKIHTHSLISFVNYFSSGVVWEMKPKQKWKPFSQKQIMSLEQAYSKRLASQDRGWVKLDSNFEVWLWFYSFIGTLV